MHPWWQDTCTHGGAEEVTAYERGPLAAAAPLSC